MFKIRLKGLNRLLGTVNYTLMSLTGDMERIVYKAGLIIERRAKENISGKHGHIRHIITGNLRRSIKTKAQQLNPTLFKAAIGTDVYYGVYVEARDPTGGFLHPALFESKKEATNYIAKEIAKRLAGDI